MGSLGSLHEALGTNQHNLNNLIDLASIDMINRINQRENMGKESSACELPLVMHSFGQERGAYVSSCFLSGLYNGLSNILSR